MARLLWIFFAGTRAQRWMFAIALLLIGSALWSTTHFSDYLLSGIKSRYTSPAVEAMMWVSLALGFILLFLSGHLMPVVVAQLVRTRLHLLPSGRIHLLVATCIALLFMAATFAAITSALFAAYPVQMGHQAVFVRALTTSFLTFTMMYVVLWLLSKIRSPAGQFTGMLLIVTNLGLPLRAISLPQESMRWPLISGYSILVLLTGLLMAGTPLAAVRAYLATLPVRLRALLGRSIYRPGRELNLLLGVTNPWRFAATQCVAALAVYRFLNLPRLWLFYFTLIAALLGAITHNAVSRSRILWLRSTGSRLQLFRHIEWTYWRLNCISVGLLMAIFWLAGSMLHFQTTLLMSGRTLIPLATVTSTYLGLMMTRRLGLIESTIAVATLGLLMMAATDASGATPNNMQTGLLEASLLAVAWALRSTARHRWQNLDWTLSRGDSGSVVRISS